MIQNLCNEYGKKIGTLNGIDYHQFPTLGIEKFHLEEFYSNLCYR